MSDFPWFPFYVDDFLASPKVRRMDAEHVGIYVLLLLEQWQQGPISEGSEDELAGVMRTHSDRIAKVLRDCFEETADGWVNRRLQSIEREQAAKSEGARKAAKARWDKASDADALRTQSERNANQNQNQNQTTTAATVGEFCKRVGSRWRLDTGIQEWADEIERDPKYAGADIPYEIRKCADWHVGKGRKPKAPDMSIRNWLERTAAEAQKKAKPKPSIYADRHNPTPWIPEDAR